MTEREFPSDVVLTVVTGRMMVRNIGKVYEILNWMTGDNLYTHQLPRVSREATPVILAKHPTLAEAISESEQVNGDNWQDWLTIWQDRYGPVIAVPKLNIAQHERIDPMSELAEKVHPSRIIPVPSTRGTGQ